MGREEHCEQMSLARAHSDSATLGCAPAHRRVCFPSLHCSDSRLLCQELSDADSGLHALLRSRPLRFRFSGTPQRHRLGWACVLHPSRLSSSGDLSSGVAPSWRLWLTPAPSQPLGFLGVQGACLLRWAMCLFWGAGLWLRPSRRMSIVQSPKKSWLAMKSACSLVSDASLEQRVPPSGPGCPRLPVSSGGWASPQSASSAQPFVL